MEWRFSMDEGKRRLGNQKIFFLIPDRVSSVTLYPCLIQHVTRTYHVTLFQKKTNSTNVLCEHSRHFCSSDFVVCASSISRSNSVSHNLLPVSIDNVACQYVAMCDIVVINVA